MKVFFPIFFLFFSCANNHLWVHLENIDKNYLASSHVNTLDYRQDDFESGQRIIISWFFPSNLYDKDLYLYLTTRFWDETQELKICAINSRTGNCFFHFSNKKILTYKVDVVTKEGNVLETWQHQLWVDLIDVDK